MRERVFAPIDFKTRFPALDGIRALAVTLVFMRHYGGGSHGGGFLQAVNLFRQRGWVGVDLFFVLSGFLITGILYDTRNDSRFFQRFFARRSVRIFPVFYMTAAALLLLTPVFGLAWQPMHATFLLYLGNWFAVHNFSLYNVVSTRSPGFVITMGHLWSLCVEEQFYLVWPLIVWFLRDRVRILWFSGIYCVLILGVRVWLVTHMAPENFEAVIVRLLPFRADTLLIGGMLALLLRGPAAQRIQASCRWVFLCGLALTLAMFAHTPDGPSAVVQSVGYTLIAITGIALIGTCLRTDSISFRLFYFKPFRMIGKYSYGFYLFHYLFLMEWIKLLGYLGNRTHSMALAGMLSLGINYVVTFILAKLSYDLVEVRFLRLKRHFEYDSELTAHKHAFTLK